MATRIATTARNAAADAVVDLLDAGAGAGYVEIRTGSQPATANTAASGTLLATITLADPAFGAAASGVALADVIPEPTTTGAAAGTAGWFRGYDSTGAAVIDGSVTASGGGGDMELNTTTISVGVDVTLTAWSVTMPAG